MTANKTSNYVKFIGIILLLYIVGFFAILFFAWNSSIIGGLKTIIFYIGFGVIVVGFSILSLLIRLLIKTLKKRVS